MSDNYIKMDGEPDSFAGGATRYSKKGKGRFDLIPPEPIYLIIGYAENMFTADPTICICKSDLIKDAYINDDMRYIQSIIDFIALYYADNTMVDEPYHLISLTYDAWFKGFLKALKELAIHYEYGAEKYGVDNWKKGIPIIGGDRGGSFTDSGLRHLNQHLLGETDEKHGVAFMWNFVNAIYLQTLEEGQNLILKEVKKDESYSFDDNNISD